MANELKPCPFCGKSARLVNPHSGNAPYITCGSCYVATVPNKSEEKLVNTWNTRPAAPVEGFRKEYAKMGRTLDALSRNASDEDIRPALRELSQRVFRALSGLNSSPLSSVEEPAAPVEALETVEYQYWTPESVWKKQTKDFVQGVAKLGGFTRELVPRSQAKAIIAAKDEALNGILQALKHHTGDNHGLMAIRKMVERYEKAEADNSALTARVKYLETENSSLRRKLRNDDLETQLAAAKEINANLMGDDEDKPRYTTKRLKQEIKRELAGIDGKISEFFSALDALNAFQRPSSGFGHPKVLKHTDPEVLRYRHARAALEVKNE